MLRIYGSPKSRGLRVLWMAGELGRPSPSRVVNALG